MKRLICFSLLVLCACGALCETTESLVPTLSVDEHPTSNPWTHLRLNNKPGNFQFSIVADRNGGARPGIFESAVIRLNLLQPEFVMSVGDFIPGYTSNESELNAQWDEFTSLVHRLKMPFFFVPGNHDLSNRAGAAKWRERFGREYYHFVYGNVLFLCVSSEDQSGCMSKEQIEYFERALQENPAVRWTLVFLHRPLWLAAERATIINADLDDPGVAADPGNGWRSFEELLKGRNYTVFAGHLHNYTKSVVNDQKYIILSTTGGGNALRGPLNYGEFDHIVWVTMTDAGPILANLELSGIWDEDVRTSDVTRLVNMGMRRGVSTERIYTEVPFTSATARIRLTNDADVAMKVEMKPVDYPGLIMIPPFIEAVVPPNSVIFRELLVNGSRLKDAAGIRTPLQLESNISFDLAGRPKVQVKAQNEIPFEPVFLAQAGGPKRIDGNLKDWKGLTQNVSRPRELAGQKKAWNGPEDLEWRFDVSHDEDTVYLAVKVVDDFISSRTGHADGVEVFLDGREQPEVVNKEVRKLSKRQRKRFKRRILAPEVVRLAISADGLTSMSVATDEALNKHAAFARVKGGYVAEFAVPMDLLKPDADVDTIRLNIAIRDIDRSISAEHNVLYWQPDWRGAENVPASGTFRITGP